MRTNLNTPRIDEQSFQHVLWAAFTVQEYNDRKLVDSSVAHGARCTDRLNSFRGGQDLDFQYLGAGANESLDVVALLECLEKQFDLSAMAIDGSDRLDVKGQAIGEKGERAALSLPGRDAPKEEIAAFATSQCAQKGDLIAPHRVGNETALQGAQIAVVPHADDEAAAIPNNLLREIVGQALQVTRATGAAIVLDRHGKLFCRAAAGDFDSRIGGMINSGSGFLGLCASSGIMQLCSNTMLDPRVDAAEYRRLGVRAILAVPVFDRDHSLGLITVFSRLPYAFGMRNVQALQDLADKLTANLQVAMEPAKLQPAS